VRNRVARVSRSKVGMGEGKHQAGVLDCSRERDFPKVRKKREGRLAAGRYVGRKGKVIMGTQRLEETSNGKEKQAKARSSMRVHLEVQSLRYSWWPWAASPGRGGALCELRTCGRGVTPMPMLPFPSSLPGLLSTHSTLRESGSPLALWSEEGTVSISRVAGICIPASPRFQRRRTTPSANGVWSGTSARLRPRIISSLIRDFIIPVEPV
jgi:hypothetical protein